MDEKKKNRFDPDCCVCVCRTLRFWPPAHPSSLQLTGHALFSHSAEAAAALLKKRRDAMVVVVVVAVEERKRDYFIFFSFLFLTQWHSGSKK